MKESMICEYFDVLSKQNGHTRDKNIMINEDEHIYFVSGFPRDYFMSVTTWKDTLFPKFDADDVSKKLSTRSKPSQYSGLTPTQIKTNWGERADLGKWLHRDIEGFLNNNILPSKYTNHDLLCLHEIAYYEWIHMQKQHGHTLPAQIETKEWRQFMRFVCDNPHLKPYRTEWMVYHEEYKLTGTIDAVFTLDPERCIMPQNEMPRSEPIFIIVDWKRSPHRVSRSESYNRKLKDSSLWFMQDTNYWKFAVQINLYTIILGDKYDIKCDYMFIVRFHPDSSTYQTIRMPCLDWALRPLLRSSAK
uniref:PD-(D/E)XK endonuclease-like domain-containing protein n=1 Tax=viral metagenome TaxID=1070528 RepID=A0A6C0CH75_9ZZZZ